MIRFVVLFLLVYVQQPVWSQDYSKLQGLGEVRQHTIFSNQLERSFYVYVRLPEGYHDNSDKYPVVYTLDGGVTFPLLASYYRYLSLGEEVPDMIIVGISYGTDDWQKGNMRGTDFTAPSSEREYWGGASDFLEVLTQEIGKSIDEHYRIKEDRRIIFGQSLGGQFVLYAANHSDYFWGYISSNPALHRNLESFLPSAVKTNQTGNRLFVSSAENDNPVFKKPATTWIEAWKEVSAKPWQLETTVLSGESHFSAAPRAFRQGLIFLFNS
ncbi:MAG: alpha/beta hydrolase-fold protein [Pseudomonadota bacterium]